MVAIDNTTLALLFHPGAKPPNDPKTGQPLVKARERIEQLITDLDAEDERIVIPTPVLCEFLILADREGPLYLEKIQGAKTLLLKPFDERAAIELAAMELSARGEGGKKAGSESPYQKVKFDRQIVAIARVNGAHTIYSDDQDLGRFAKNAGMKVVCTWDLPIPPSKTPLFDDLPDVKPGDSRKQGPEPNLMNGTEQLLLKIARCEVAQDLVGKPGIHHPCSTVVAEQKVSSWGKFQVPEPWSGHLQTARILFLSSNPSISATEAYPTGPLSEGELVDFFDKRFHGYWVKDGKFARNNEITQQATGKEYGKAVRYWANIRNRAEELIAKAVPGVDYALSEVVHCKSIMAAGVDSALATCGSRYLRDVLACSGAKVLVLVGKKSLDYWTSLAPQMGLPNVPLKEGTGPHEIAGRQRYCVYLPAPAAFGGDKKFETLLQADQLEKIRSFLSA